MADDFITQLFNQPYIWIIIILILILLIVMKLTGRNKKRPEQRPFYGVEVRENMTRKQMDSRLQVWGYRTNFIVTRGLTRIGKGLRFDPIYIQNTNDTRIIKKETKDILQGVNPNVKFKEIYSISFRNFGFMAWLKSFFGKHENILCDPNVLTIDEKKKIIIIDPKAHMINNSGIWTLHTKKEYDVIDMLNYQKDLENVKGFVSDFPRRLSNLDPNQAKSTEQLRHYYEEEEKARKSKVGRWVGGN